MPKSNSSPIVVLLATLFLIGCGSDNSSPERPDDGPVITTFTPASDTALAVITITGSGFAATADGNSVKIGDMAAPLLTAAANQVTVQIPAGAITGKLSVSVDGKTGVSANDFQVEMIPVVIPNAIYNDVAWTGSRFVAVGTSGAIAFSEDGRAWSSGVSHTTAELTSVAGNSSGMVAVGANATVLFSANGADWQPRSNTASGYLVSVCANASRFVAVPAYGNYVLSSSDGLSWTKCTLDTALTMTHVGWFGRFTAFADRLWAISSLGGLSNWSRGVTNLVGPEVIGAAWSGTRSILVKEHSLHYLSGENLWGDCNPSSSLMDHFADIAWTGDYFVVAGDSSLICSPDGWNWKAHTEVSAGSLVPLKVACSPEACVIVGGLGATAYYWQQP